ncbi:MAG TPA: IS30 family transposase, partial [Aquihabitans sp.]|nr:IS30 family transposase [Aquihabitans sp.]
MPILLRISHAEHSDTDPEVNPAFHDWRLECRWSMQHLSGLDRGGWRMSVSYVRLSFQERTEISRRRKANESVREIARALDRAPSTISREVRRNADLKRGYNPSRAQGLAKRRSKRPKVFKLEANRWLARQIAVRLAWRWSPEQIAGRLRLDHPDDPRWWVSPETIYQSLFVQSRGGLADELTAYLRTRRPKRRAPQANRGHGQLTDMVMISERPAEANDRAVPGHWEGDLVQGGYHSQIGTLVERTSRYLIVVPLPNGRSADIVAPAIAETIKELPAHLARSLTWDQGKEMARHTDITIATDVQVYFAEPGKPW